MAVLPILAALATAAGTPTASEEVFRTFKSLCVDTSAEAAAAVSLADKAGWTPVPQEALQRFDSVSGDPKNLKVRAKRVGEAVWVLIAERSEPAKVGGTMSNHCQLNVTGADYVALRSLVSQWAGVPAFRGVNAAQGAAFAFADNGGHHSALSEAEINAPAAKFAAAARSRRVTQLSVFNLSRGAALRIDIAVH